MYYRPPYRKAHRSLPLHVIPGGILAVDRRLTRSLLVHLQIHCGVPQVLARVERAALMQAARQLPRLFGGVPSIRCFFRRNSQVVVRVLLVAASGCFQDRTFALLAGVLRVLAQLDRWRDRLVIHVHLAAENGDGMAIDFRPADLSVQPQPPGRVRALFLLNDGCLLLLVEGEDAPDYAVAVRSGYVSLMALGYVPVCRIAVAFVEGVFVSDLEVLSRMLARSSHSHVAYQGRFLEIIERRRVV